MQNSKPPKRQRTKQAITEAGLTLLKQSGTAFTMNELALAAGVSRRTLFNHFSGKTELLLAIGETSEARYCALIDQYLGSEAKAEEALIRLFESIEQQWQRQGHRAGILYDALAQARSSEHQAAALQAYGEAFMPHLRHWQQQQWIRADIDLSAASQLLSTTLSSAVFMLRAGADRAQYWRYVKLASSAILPARADD